MHLEMNLLNIMNIYLEKCVEGVMHEPEPIPSALNW